MNARTWIAMVLATGTDTVVDEEADHVVLETPSRTDWFDGNSFVLSAPPDAGDLPRWLRRWDERWSDSRDHVQLVWPTTTDAAAPPGLAEAASRLDLELSRYELMRLDRPRSVDPGPYEPRLARLDTDWAGVRVLHRWLGAEVSDDFWRWRIATYRQLAAEGRCWAWLAHRLGIPACTVIVVRDAAGTAVVDGVATHPAHRGRGLASTLVQHACQVHRFSHPADDLWLIADQDGGAAELYRRSGFRSVGLLWQLLRWPGGQGEDE